MTNKFRKTYWGEKYVFVVFLSSQKQLTVESEHWYYQPNDSGRSMGNGEGKSRTVFYLLLSSWIVKSNHILILTSSASSLSGLSSDTQVSSQDFVSNICYKLPLNSLQLLKASKRLCRILLFPLARYRGLAEIQTFEA